MKIVIIIKRKTFILYNQNYNDPRLFNLTLANYCLLGPILRKYSLIALKTSINRILILNFVVERILNI